MKNRIRQITDEQMGEVMEEIAAGKIGKVKGEEERERESLEVQVDVRDVF